MSSHPEDDPFAQFRTTFFEECAELLAALEAALEDMSGGGSDPEALQSIFRAVHSIKAGAGSFQMNRLVEFTHRFETLLDELREGSLSVTPDLLELLFRASDVLAAMVDLEQEGKPVPVDMGADALAGIDAALAPLEEGTGKNPNSNAGPSEIGTDTDDGDNRLNRFEISFYPKPELFRHANEPLHLIRELTALGELEIVADIASIPSLTQIDPECAYIRWDMVLTTDASIETVSEVFEFVEDDCELRISEKAAPAQETEEPVETEGSGTPPKEPGTSRATDSSSTSSGQRPNANDQPVSKKAAPVSSIRVDLDRVDRLVNMVGELVIAQAMLRQDIDNDPNTSKATEAGIETLAFHTRELQENVMAIRMQPVKSVFARMPRLVRDVSAKVNKKVRLVTLGETTEVDKTVIEELSDPLTHMIRNSVDHGLETPDERVACGKPEEGTITLSAEHRGGRIVIEVADDGRGVNRERVLDKAKDRGLVEPDARLSDEEIDQLIFLPGFSTASEVTDLSGRGVGMDVVRRNIQALGGRIALTSTPGVGARFTLSLPLTLAVLDGMLVAVGQERYVLPISTIVETIRPAASQVETLVGGTQVVRVRGEYLHLVSVAQAFGISGAQADPTKALVVIVETDSGKMIGLLVDELLGQQQVVIKSLEANYSQIEGVSAATILGDGRVSLILDPDGIARRNNRSETLGEYATSRFGLSPTPDLHAEIAGIAGIEGQAT